METGKRNKSVVMRQTLRNKKRNKSAKVRVPQNTNSAAFFNIIFKKKNF